MQAAKLDIYIAFLAYGGNGGIGMQLPEITLWYAKTLVEMQQDKRIGKILTKKFGDIPLTMERNRAVRCAKDVGADVIVMIDSDNVPDLYVGWKDWAKPFWKTSFDFLYERKLRGLPTVVCAPYCGPPPHPTGGGYENVYVFHGEANESDVAEQHIRFCAYSREHAAQMRGIQSIAAGPTGVVMYSLDALDLMNVHRLTHEQILQKYKAGDLTLERAKQLLAMQSWFFYEYTDAECTAKASTEDVTNTREIQMAGLVKHKQPVVFCNWDSWAGHYKPKCVGMPEPIYVETINQNYVEAVKQNVSLFDTLEEVDFMRPEDQPSRVLQEGEETPPDIEAILAEIAAEVDPTPAAAQPQQPLAAVMPDGQIMPAVTKRLVAGRTVTSVGHNSSSEDLNALTEIVAWVAESRPQKELRIVEVGSWVGESALSLHAGLGPAGGTIWCIDTWEGTPTDTTGVWAEVYGYENLFEVFKQNIGELLDKDIKAVHAESVAQARSMRPQDADIIFLDAGHTYEEFKADLDAWLPHVAADGILCGHDFCTNFPGVVRGVSELCESAGIQVRLVNDTIVWMVAKAEYLAGLAKRQQPEQAAEATPEPLPVEVPAALEKNNHRKKAALKRDRHSVRKAAAASQDQI